MGCCSGSMQNPCVVMRGVCVGYRNANSVTSRTGLSQQTEACADALLRSGSQLLLYASNLVVHTLRTINSRSKSKA
jgi:hypothetical protein